MKEVELNEFLSNADDIIKRASIGDEYYIVKTSCGKAVIIDEAEWNIMTDAFRVLAGNKPIHCDD